MIAAAAEAQAKVAPEPFGRDPHHALVADPQRQEDHRDVVPRRYNADNSELGDSAPERESAHGG